MKRHLLVNYGEVISTPLSGEHDQRPGRFTYRREPAVDPQVRNSRRSGDIQILVRDRTREDF
jgi:hypothetical protein